MKLFKIAILFAALFIAFKWYNFNSQWKSVGGAPYSFMSWTCKEERHLDSFLDSYLIQYETQKRSDDDFLTYKTQPAGTLFLSRKDARDAFLEGVYLFRSHLRWFMIHGEQKVLEVWISEASEVTNAMDMVSEIGKKSGSEIFKKLDTSGTALVSLRGMTATQRGEEPLGILCAEYTQIDQSYDKAKAAIERCGGTKSSAGFSLSPLQSFCKSLEEPSH